MPTEITSVQNPRVKQWSELLLKRGRERQGRMLLEGIHLVKEALESGIILEALLYLQQKGIPGEIEEILPQSTERVAVSEPVLAKCSDTETPQGVVGVALKPQPDALGLLAVPNALVVAVDGVQDPGNLGTIIRTADAAGAAGVIVGKGSVDPYNPKTLRATMGSLFHLPVVESALPPILQEATRHGAALFTTGMQAEQTCYEADFTGATWFVVGNEGAGVSEEVRALIGREISIPMPGKAESLNVAMAAGVLLYEALRQRML